MELRANARDVTISGTETVTDTANDRKATAARASEICIDEPEQYVAGREKEIVELGKNDRETGYMHTHPVTQERIRAAEAAATR